MAARDPCGIPEYARYAQGDGLIIERPFFKRNARKGGSGSGTVRGVIAHGLRISVRFRRGVFGVDAWEWSSRAVCRRWHRRHRRDGHGGVHFHYKR